MSVRLLLFPDGAEVSIWDQMPASTDLVPVYGATSSPLTPVDSPVSTGLASVSPISSSLQRVDSPSSTPLINLGG